MAHTQAEFQGRFIAPGQGGWIRLDYEMESDGGPDLSIEYYPEHNYDKARGGFFVVGVANPGPELLAMCARAALGLLPLEVFADWLEDRIDELPRVAYEYDGCDETVRRHHLRSLCVQMRRIAAVPEVPS